MNFFKELSKRALIKQALTQKTFTKKAYLIATLTLPLVVSPIALAETSQLIYNINGYTMSDRGLQRFHSIQFNGDKIEKLYRAHESLPNDQSMTRLDGKGKTLLPGLIDAHGHVLNYGLSLLSANLNGTTSEQNAVEKVKSHYQKQSAANADTWVLGRGWNQTHWPNKEFPSAASLDKVFPERAVLLNRVDGHAIWVNSKAMKLAGINKNTPSPAGGEIVKDSNGEPTGIFIDNAMELIFKVQPALSIGEKKAALIRGLSALAEVGLTSVHDAGISAENIELYKSLAKEQNMAIRVNGMLDINDSQTDNILAQGHYQSPDQMFALHSVKISSDGALGSRGAALIHDYSDLPGHKGLLLYPEKELKALMLKAMKAGFQVNTHAIGDNANKLVLDLYQDAIKQTNTRDLRHRIEHAQVLQLSDIERFAKLNIVASIQATHATSDKNMAQDRLGKKRLAGAYAWRKLLSANAKLANGSDFPIEPTNPLFGLHAAITRQDRDNQPLGGWISSESMTRTEAFASFTIDAAYAGHQEHIIGSLAAGKKADFILLAQDPFTIDAENIWQIKVLETWVNGNRVYKN